jgi:hypothetical protein
MKRLEEEGMEAHKAYCSACDRQVDVVVRPGGDPDNAEDLVCLAYGETCTGSLCPLFGNDQSLHADARQEREQWRSSN